MGQAGDYFKAVILISLVLVLGAAMVPTALNTMNDPFESTIVHEEATSYQVKGPVYANATTINATSQEVTLELNNTETGTVTSATIANNTTSALTVDGVTYNVTVNDIADTNTSTLTYEAPKDAHWNGASAVMFGLLGVIALVAILLTIIRPFLDF